MTAMWEILVPTEKRVKTPAPDADLAPGDYSRWLKRNSFSTRYHKVWDARVREISGGLTILTPAKGQWVSPDGELFSERMIPVRVIATCEQINEIMDFTLKYYDQLAVLCYKISDEVLLKQRES